MQGTEHDLKHCRAALTEALSAGLQKCQDRRAALSCDPCWSLRLTRRETDHMLRECRRLEADHETCAVCTCLCPCLKASQELQCRAKYAAPLRHNCFTEDVGGALGSGQEGIQCAGYLTYSQSLQCGTVQMLPGLQEIQGRWAAFLNDPLQHRCCLGTWVHSDNLFTMTKGWTILG